MEKRVNASVGIRCKGLIEQLENDGCFPLNGVTFYTQSLRLVVVLD